MSEIQPSEGSVDQGAQGGGVPEEPAKRKLATGWFALGFFVPLVAYAVSFMLLLGGISSGGGSWLGYGLPALNVAVFLAAAAAWLVGRAKGNNALRSLGLGALASYAVTALLGMLLFGACMVAYNGGGN
jgi:hypothetical protein